jgi:hypothetical protein
LVCLRKSSLVLLKRSAIRIFKVLVYSLVGRGHPFGLHVSEGLFWICDWIREPRRIIARTRRGNRGFRDRGFRRNILKIRLGSGNEPIVLLEDSLKVPREAWIHL